MLKWFSLVVVLVGLDQLTKYLANTQLTYGQPLEIFSWFNLTLAYNKGAAFSFLSEATGWQRWFFTAIAVIAAIVITAWLRKLKSHEWLIALSLSMILSGAIGNLIDRIMHGYVIDFIQWHYHDWYWPAFNIADSAITVGAVLLVMQSLFFKKETTGDQG
jgi:signal peptidase II